MKFSISGFFLEEKVWQVVFELGSLIQVRIFWVFKTILRFVIVLEYPGRIVPLEIFMARKFGMGFFGG